MRTALEVQQSFCDTHLDTRHFRSGEVDAGSNVAWRWRFLGVDMGTVPSALRHVLPWLPPIWSECEPVETAHFQVPDDDGVQTLFLQGAQGWTVGAPTGWTVEQDGAPVRGEVPVSGTVTLRKGDVAFRATLVEAPTAPARTAPAPEPPFLASFAMMAATGLLFGLGVYFAPAPASVSLVEVPDRITQMVIAAPPAEKPKPVQKVAEGGGPSGPKSPRSSEPVRSGTKAERDNAVVAEAGIMSALNGGWSSGDFSDLAALTDGLAVASGHGPAMGGLNGRGDSLGGGGGDAEGFDYPGGDGIGDRQYGYGPGGPLTGKPGGQPIAIGQEPMIIGGLEPRLIDEVIKRHLNQIRYCYQRQLQRNPGLGGKLVVKFTIAKNGAVSSASVKSSTLGNAEVDQCVTDRIRRLQFAEPRGGGIAIVSYPFLFSPG
ncbi:MAG: TonB family protein [Alphaproteobacteria bacterium]|nr:TonB family protein [Alphaproteobacteria bacterium]